MVSTVDPRYFELEDIRIPRYLELMFISPVFCVVLLRLIRTPVSYSKFPACSNNIKKINVIVTGICYVRTPTRTPLTSLETSASHSQALSSPILRGDERLSQL